MWRSPRRSPWSAASRRSPATSPTSTPPATGPSACASPPSWTQAGQVSFASPGQTYVVRNQGPITHTGNSLDVAVDGDGWFGLETPTGTVYTRDGRFHMTANGDLQSVNGYGVLDSGGSPITLDPSGGPVQIGEDGAISQGGKRLGVIGLFTHPRRRQAHPPRQFRRHLRQAGRPGRGHDRQQRPPGLRRRLQRQSDPRDDPPDRGLARLRPGDRPPSTRTTR